jgi:hypothetical protein
MGSKAAGRTGHRRRREQARDAPRACPLPAGTLPAAWVLIHPGRNPVMVEAVGVVAREATRLDRSTDRCYGPGYLGSGVPRYRF